MDRKKPSLTSPWKVGFLVALLLVVTTLGVSYFITGTFGITWHWIHIGGLSPATWTFNTGAFIEEMMPLLVLTSLLAFASYVLVAGAVRRYKAYVDSGAEYKQLLKSIKSIDDLEDEAILDRLKHHQELREFMMGIRHRVAALEKNPGERERRSAPAVATERDERPRLQSEAAMLASAIASGRDAFPGEIALTVPELKQIERAARNAFAALAATPAPAAAPAGSPELDSLRAGVRSTARSIRLDVEACTSGARELEAALAGVTAALQARPASSTKSTEAHKSIDLMVDALAALGEETRRIAIASAMQATGGPEADAIKVADELRTLAKRFNTVAQHWREAAPALKQSLGGGNGQGPVDGKAAAAASSAISKTRLWTERTIAMAEHARSLDRLVGGVDAEPVDAPRAPVSTVDLADEPVVPTDGAAPAADSGDDFITRGNADLFASDDNDVSLADVPGFEKEHRLFSEPAGAQNAVDDRFEVDSAEDNRWDVTADAGEPAVEAAPAPGETPGRSHDADGFLTGPRPVVSPKKIERPAPAARTVAPAPVLVPEPEPATATATLDPDADAIDLYELGAIDCVQTA